MTKPGTTVIDGARIFDGDRSTGVGTVVIEGGGITRVELDPTARTAVSAEYGNAAVVDGSGATLLPGLIDAHVHLHGPENLEQARAWGVTTMLDMATRPPALVDELRGRTGLPDIRSSYAPASAPGGIQTTVMGFPDTVVSTPEEAEPWVVARAAEGADYIKIIVEDPTTMGPAALDAARITALVAAAHARGLRTIAHASRDAAVRLALDCGLDMITHAPLDRAMDSAAASRMIDAGTVSIPTLIMMRTAAATIGSMPTHGGRPVDFDNARSTVTTLHRAGVPILAGTDSNAAPRSPAQVPHGEAMHQELELLVEAGLTPVEALRAATSLPAAHFGLADRGVIAPGRRADLVLVGGDPTKDVSTTRNIRRLWCGGIEYTPATGDRRPAMS